LKAGATDYVTKAVSDDFLELLFSAIEQAIEQKKLATQKLETERELREARDRAETLLREVNHRVANSLSLVASMVRLQASALRDMGAKAALTETEARIIAIAGVHRRLYTSPDVRTVDLAAYLEGLVRELEQSLKAAERTTLIRLESEPIVAPTDKAVSLGVIVTEMVTNAFKYAYQDSDGEVRIKLSRAGADTAELRVEDDGVGWDGHGTPKGTGVGTKIIRAMAENLGSAVSYEARPAGTCARLVFAL
jgi:two-component sensor histidine kinase